MAGWARQRATLGRLTPWLAGAAAGALAIGPGLGPGLVLRYDMVFVPNPPLSAATLNGGGGFPRAVPSDALVGALALILPVGAVQALLLLAVFVLGAAGAARLVPGGNPVAGTAAGLYYVWNPFVAERLLLGQWAVLLGYAGLPWVLGAVVRLRRAHDLPRTIVALVPAAVGGFSSVVLSGLVAGPAVLLRTGDRPRRSVYSAVLLAAGLAAVSLPWLVPALASRARTDPAAVELFAARADTPLGVAGSLFTLGGIWNAHAVPLGHEQPFLAACRLVLALAALAGWMWLLRRYRMLFGVGLTAAAAAGFGIALLGVAEPGRELLGALIGFWPGFGPLRDGQLYVAPLALLQAVGFGGAVLWLWGTEPKAGWRGDEAREGAHRTPRGRATAAGTAGPVAAVLLLFAPFVLLPGLAWGAAGRLVPVEYPGEWSRVQSLVAQDPRPGAVLSLPWSAYRGLDWGAQARTVVVLDPATKLFDRRVVWNDDLRIGAQGRVGVVEGEDPLARRIAPLLDASRPYEVAPGVPERLGELGVRYVLIERAAAEAGTAGAANENTFWPELEGVEIAHEGPRLLLLEMPDDHVEEVNGSLSGLEVTGWLVTVGAVVWSVAVSGSSLVPIRPARNAGAVSRKGSSK